MVFRDGFPVGHQNLFKDLTSDLLIHPHGYPAGQETDDLAYYHRYKRISDHHYKILDDLSGLMPGDNIYEVTADECSQQADNSISHTDSCIYYNALPETSDIGIDPSDLMHHVLEHAGLYSIFNFSKIFLYYSHVKRISALSRNFLTTCHVHFLPACLIYFLQTHIDFRKRSVVSSEP